MSDARPPIRIGLVLAGRPTARERRLVLAAANRLERDLAAWFPRYAWGVEPRLRPDIGAGGRAESSELLRLAADVRDAERHDFVLLLTADELVARYRAFALAALSRPLDAAVLSLARLAPERGLVPEAAAGASLPATPDPDADTVVVDRVATLMAHALAHLAGERATRDRTGLLHHPETPGDLDAMTRFDERELVALDAAFGDVADARLEETEGEPARGAAARWRFALRAAAINRGEIGEAVRAARPWEFPKRLSRLTTAALSTLAVLLMTAESWDLGLSQGWVAVATLALVVLGATTAFVVDRQQLLLERRGRLTEQLVATRVTAVAIVAAGLATTWLGVFLLAALAALTLFDAPLIVGWAASQALEAASVGLEPRLRMAAFCASIGLLIGSLGASFEEQHHFRHVIFVDEEL